MEVDFGIRTIDVKFGLFIPNFAFKYTKLEFLFFHHYDLLVMVAALWFVLIKDIVNVLTCTWLYITLPPIGNTDVFKQVVLGLHNYRRRQRIVNSLFTSSRNTVMKPTIALSMTLVRLVFQSCRPTYWTGFAPFAIAQKLSNATRNVSAS